LKDENISDIKALMPSSWSSEWKKTLKGAGMVEAIIMRNAKELIQNEISRILFMATFSPFSAPVNSDDSFGRYVVRTIMEYLNFVVSKFKDLSDGEKSVLLDWMNNWTFREGRKKVSPFPYTGHSKENIKGGNDN
jgi:hypothetical protein